MVLDVFEGVAEEGWDVIGDGDVLADALERVAGAIDLRRDFRAPHALSRPDAALNQKRRDDRTDRGW